MRRSRFVSQRKAGVAGLVSLGLVVGIALAVSAIGGTSGPINVVPGQATTTPPEVGVHDASIVPVDLAFPQVTAWTGSEVVLFGAAPNDNGGGNRAKRLPPR